MNKVMSSEYKGFKKAVSEANKALAVGLSAVFYADEDRKEVWCVDFADNNSSINYTEPTTFEFLRINGIYHEKATMAGVKEALENRVFERSCTI